LWEASNRPQCSSTADQQEGSDREHVFPVVHTPYDFYEDL
jgi:hypothetical protein